MIFHLAIPANNLNESMEFYRSLGASFGRQYPTSFIMNLFGAQVVCHKSETTEEPKMYPRHFGVILEKENHLYREWMKHIGKAYVFEPFFKRHVHKKAEHHTFFLKDPSNNLIEFKWYKEPEAIFN
jgi:extradiol dioxygenase family protein